MSKRVAGDDIDRSGVAIISLLQQAVETSRAECDRANQTAREYSLQVRVAKDLVNKLQIEVAQLEKRARRAEDWLVRIRAPSKTRLFVRVANNSASNKKNRQADAYYLSASGPRPLELWTEPADPISKLNWTRAAGVWPSPYRQRDKAPAYVSPAGVRCSGCGMTVSLARNDPPAIKLYAVNSILRFTTVAPIDYVRKLLLTHFNFCDTLILAPQLRQPARQR